MRIAFILFLLSSNFNLQSQNILDFHTLRSDGGLWPATIKKSDINTIIWANASGDTILWDDNKFWYKLSDYAGDKEAYFVILDSLQNQKIYKQFYSNEDNNVFCEDIELLSDGSFILSFSAKDSLWMNDSLIYVDDSLSLNRAAFHVMKIKPDGSVAFHTIFQGGFVLDAWLGQLPEGKIVVAGTVYSRDIRIGDYDLHCLGCHAEDSDIILAVLDSTGKVLNAKRFGGFSYDYCDDLLCSADGSIYITGSFGSNPFNIDSLVLNNNLGWISSDAYLAKLDGDLQAHWIKQARSDYDESGVRIIEDKADDLLWAVRYFGPKAYFEGDTIPGGENNSFLCKISPGGDTKWLQSFSSANYNSIFDVSADEHNNLWLAVSYRDTLTFEGGPIIGAGYQDNALVQLDSEGNYLRSFNLAEPCSESLTQVEALPGDRLFVVGSRDSLNFLNMHFGPKEGFGLPNFCFVLQLPPVSTHESPETRHSLDISLFPVPASDRLHIQTGACADDFNGCIRVYDALGRLCSKQNIDVRCEGAASSLEVGGLPPGMYSLEIRDSENRRAGTARFIRL